MLKYPAIVHKDPDGLWLEFPDLEGCVTEGDDMEELMEMAEDALSLYLEEYDERNIPAASTIEGENVVYVEPSPEVAIPLTLKLIRHKKQMTQKDIARALGISYQTYQQVENLHKFNATVKTLKKIADVLGKKLKIDLV